MPHSLKIKLRIDWSEMDVFGHINNVMFAKYIQSARVNYVEYIGIMKMLKEDNKGFMLASSSIQFIKPLFYPGNISIETSCSFIKTTSFGLTHTIITQTNEIAAEGNDVLVMYDFNLHNKIDVPNSVRTAIENIGNS